ncbi:MAG TPA: hypothetical protein VN795_03515 [Stellaceae bacterium]|nr:hypothetical protein [Stellaceae bacterium]
MPLVKYSRLVKYTHRQRSRKERLFTGGLWLAAAVAVVAGFALRILASFTHRLDIRFGGIALIALGLLFAMLAAAVESFISRRMGRTGSQGTKR